MVRMMEWMNIHTWIIISYMGLTLGVASSHYSSMHKNMMYFFDIDIIRFIAAARGRYICIVNYIYIYI